MAIALVKAGSIATGTTAPLSPAFGQATTAGNLLICRVYGVFTGVNKFMGVSGTGWTFISGSGHASLGDGSCVIAYKANCGAGETAPTVTVTSGATITYLAADLTEWSGAAISGVVDQVTGTSSDDTGSTSPASLATSAADTGKTDLIISVLGVINSKSATYTFSDSFTPSTGASAGTQDTGGTSLAEAVRFSGFILTSNAGGAADANSVTITPSKGTLSGYAGTMASFKAAVPYAPSSLIRGQAVHQSNNW